MRSPYRSRLLAGLLVAAAAIGSAEAQDKSRQTGKLPNTYQGLGVASDEPIQFEAESLEVREADSMAVFTGNVVVRQNQTVLKTDRLVVYYTGQAADAVKADGAAPAAAEGGAPGGAQQVKRLEANGNVLVTSGPQTASGNQAVFDTAAETIVLTGNVVLTQGANVIRGPKLVINIATSQARMEGGRVQMLIEPRSLGQ